MRILVIAVLLSFMACSSANKKKTDGMSSKTEKSMKSSAVSKGEVEDSVSCSKDNDHRKIQSIKNSDGGCEVSYEKWDKVSVIGSAVSDMSYCTKLVAKVKGNLEGFGFTCK